MDEKRIRNHITAARDQIRNSLSNLDVAIERNRQEQLAQRKDKREKAEKYNQKTVEEIAQSDNLEEWAAALLADYDHYKMTGSHSLTKEQKQEISNAFTTQEEADIYRDYAKLYGDLVKYNEKLQFVYKSYQIETSLLANLITKWEVYKDEAKTMTAILTATAKDSSTVREALLDIIPTLKKGEVQFHYNLETEEVEADIFFKGGLFHKIEKQVKDVSVSLSLLKGYVEAIEEYLTENKYSIYAPSALIQSIKDSKEGTFSRSVIEDKYHHNTTITALSEGEKKLLGIVPDYYHTETNKNVLEYCRLGVKIIRDGERK